MNRKIRSVKQRIIALLDRRNKRVDQFDTPLALFEWLVAAWKAPLAQARLRELYLASWELSLEHGLVDL